MKPNPKMKKLVAELYELSGNLYKRIADDGTILGWQGFHVQLGSVEDLAQRLRLLAVGIDRPMSEETSEPGGTDP